MKTARLFNLILVTAPNRKTARVLARAALEARLVACANLIPAIESHYWWQGKLEQSNEILIVFKTTKSRLDPLEKLILAQHPYDTPEIIALPIATGTERYLRWISTEVGAGGNVKRKA
jgi:periplasmic divalent cation tolerance protein